MARSAKRASCYSCGGEIKPIEPDTTLTGACVLAAVDLKTSLDPIGSLFWRARLTFGHCGQCGLLQPLTDRQLK